MSSWFFTRKAPCWRLRYRPTADCADKPVRRHLDQLVATGSIAAWTEVIYEPEVHAFGGPEAMTIAHQLFHADSHHVVDYLGHDGSKRRELSILLCSILMRAARQDWYEQGDIWARVAEHREPPAAIDRVQTLEPALRRLMTTDTHHAIRDDNLTIIKDWVAAFQHAGDQLHGLAQDGALTRGIRGILAHHVLFAWNRLGLAHQGQSLLAHAAKSAVLDDDRIRQRHA